MRRVGIAIIIAFALLAYAFAIVAGASLAQAFDANEFCASNSCTTVQINGDPGSDHVDYVAVCPTHTTAVVRDNRWECTPSYTAGYTEVRIALRRGDEMTLLEAAAAEPRPRAESGGGPYERTYPVPNISARERRCIAHPSIGCGID
jgi:hypothetical protein